MKIYQIIRAMFYAATFWIFIVYVAYIMNEYINYKNYIAFYDNLPKEDWTKTASGRYAHSLKYENLIKPNNNNSYDYFTNLCQNQAGNYIWKKGQPSESIVLLRSFEPPKGTIPFEKIDIKPGFEAREYTSVWKMSKYYEVSKKESPIKMKYYKGVFIDGLEAPIVNNFFEPTEDDYKSTIYPLIDITSSYAQSEIWLNDGHVKKIIKKRVLNNSKTKADEQPKTIGDQNSNYPYFDIKVSDEKVIHSRYGVTWKGITTKEQQLHGIMGDDLIIIDLYRNEIIAVQRNFGLVPVKYGEEFNWENAETCLSLKDKELYDNNYNYSYIYKVYMNKSKDKAYKELKEITQRNFIEEVIPPLYQDIDDNYKRYDN